MELLVNYRFLIVPLVVWGAIQIFKFIWDAIATHKVDFKRLLGAGGMPSSHSAVVTCIATMIGKTEGFDSKLFALSVVFACIVMYDAAGVRRAAGKQAKILNKIVATPGMTSLQVQEKLVEVLGHTPIQVFVGAVVGAIVGFIVG